MEDFDKPIKLLGVEETHVSHYTVVFASVLRRRFGSQVDDSGAE